MVLFYHMVFEVVDFGLLRDFVVTMPFSDTFYLSVSGGMGRGWRPGRGPSGV